MMICISFVPVVRHRMPAEAAGMILARDHEIEQSKCQQSSLAFDA
jgi:hypothetical protein